MQFHECNLQTEKIILRLLPSGRFTGRVLICFPPTSLCILRDSDEARPSFLCEDFLHPPHKIRAAVGRRTVLLFTRK
jgi:hypothetical protein